LLGSLARNWWGAAGTCAGAHADIITRIRPLVTPLGEGL
jgi:hypothetical protein